MNVTMEKNGNVGGVITVSLEEKVKASGKSWGDFTLEELDIFWDQAKENQL